MRFLYGVFAEDDHVGLSFDRVGEIVFVNVSILLVAAVLVILLQTEHIYLFVFHLREDVVRDESGSLFAKSGHVVACYLYGVSCRLLV